MEEGSKPVTENRPRWLVTKDEPPPGESHHVWAPRPVGRSILWTPVGERRNAPTGPYEVFVKQRAIEAMHRHLWSADQADEPFGYLFGYLCEDRESQRRYVIVSSAIASAYPLYEHESEQIAPEAIRALRREEGKNDGVLAGWYHRHREGPVRLSDEDEATHREHFGQPWQVAFLMVTDPGQPVGGCLQPLTHGVTAHTPLPFYELANAASLLARGIRRTRIDWKNVETATHVLVEPLPRPKVRPAAAESHALDVTEAQVEADPEPISTDAPSPESDEIVFELEHLDPPSALELAPESEAHFELLSVAAIESADVPDVSVDEATLEEAAEVVQAEAAEATELIEAEDSAPETELPTELELEAELAPEVEPEPTRETEAPALLVIEPLNQPEQEAEPEPAEEVTVAPPAAVQWVEPAPNLRPRPAPPPLADAVPRPEPAVPAETEVSPAPEPPAEKRPRSSHWDGAIESLLVLVAVGSIVVGAWPLPGGSRTASEDLPDFATALAGFVMPAAVQSPVPRAFDDSDPLAPLGREVRAAVGRFSAVLDVFAARRLTCEPLREAYVDVDAAWNAYSAAIARTGGERSEGEARRDEAVAQEVQDAEASFTSSGCERP